MECRRGFTLVEIMIVVAIIGMLAAIAIPSYKRARAYAQANACVENLRQIMGAKDRYALENNKVTGDPVTQTELIPYFVKKWEECPAGGTYSINEIGADPECSRGGSHTF